MIIPKLNYSLYGLIIVISIFIGMLYIYLNLKDKYNNKQFFYYYMIYITFAFYGGKMFTILTSNEKISFFYAGLSSYGGLIGIIIGSIIFEKIINYNGKIIKYSVLSLPLVYGLSKIACFIAGCCGGIPYEGIFKVVYKDKLNIGQFPVQIIETIVFLIIFIICNKNRNKENISYYTIIICSITKFLLDFFRYDHIKTLITKNQIFSIILISITIIIILYKKIFQKLKQRVTK